MPKLENCVLLFDEDIYKKDSLKNVNYFVLSMSDE